MVKVYTHTYSRIFKEYSNISVPEYQRPYRWKPEQVEELLNDFEEFFIKKPVPNLEYYMGSILFFNNKRENTAEIIDGQQRLTTLTLIQYSIEGQLHANQNLLYNNHVSFYYIKKNLAYLEQKKDLLEKLQALNFLDKLRFTLILSNNEDNAFAFFDSQNNRGVTLGADDYLKAYHLRSVRSEELQEVLAQQWEQTAFLSQKENNKEAGLEHLFYKVLYRGRQWKGQSQLTPENKDEILKAFQKKTRSSTTPDFYELYPNRVNQKYEAVKIKSDDSVILLEKERCTEDKASLPFSLRQPIFKGHNFFQYTQKYHSIHQLIFSDNSTVSDMVKKAREYYNNIYTENMSVYLRHYMQLCMVLYYDVFGDQQLDAAIKYFDYLIGSIRIHKYYVKKEAVKNSLMECSNNVLDVIANAYLPEEVFDFIVEQNQPKEIYEKEKLENDTGVRNSYKRRVLTYFNRNEKTLKDRLSWIK